MDFLPLASLPGVPGAVWEPAVTGWPPRALSVTSVRLTPVLLQGRPRNPVDKTRLLRSRVLCFEFHPCSLTLGGSDLTSGGSPRRVKEIMSTKPQKGLVSGVPSPLLSSGKAGPRVSKSFRRDYEGPCGGRGRSDGGGHGGPPGVGGIPNTDKRLRSVGSLEWNLPPSRAKQ